MPTYTAELPVDLENFRYWFRNMFQGSLWGMALETITVFSTKDDEQSRRIATREELYIISRLGVLVAHVHCRAFRADRLYVQAVQFLPYAHLPSERKETFQDDGSGELKPVWTGGDERYILDGLRDWFTFMYGPDQVREIREEPVQLATRMAQVMGEQIYWTDVYRQAKASGNISEYLRERGIARQTYYDNVERFRLDVEER